MESILDRSNSYLRIFTQKVEIDKNLPKWKIIEDEKKKEKQKDLGIETPSNLNKKLIITSESSRLDDQVVDGDSVSLAEFLNFSSKDYNVYVGKKIVQNLKDNYRASEMIWAMEDESLEILANGNSKKNDDGKFKSVIKKVTKFFRETIGPGNKISSEEVYEMDIFAFFDNVKGLLKESHKAYVQRIEPYIIAMKQANDMGQTALVDELTANIFINKYESILYAAKMYQRITEEQLVNFVKKSEKGVQLCYVKNFARPIPLEVAEKKKEADKLLVFDNYCILYYDKDTKAFKQTEAEKEKERRKKADPILFGMIHGSRNLYYVADWIDEYCDLTLDEFLKVSGIEKQHIEITEKIKI